ncbi:hypothetical protein [Pontibacter actiniarum]|uniref:DUF3618 domain-containing protein n=1 Tax=Pontibacter actiniarum TaxID=323450 RepID=A0A1X9YRH9_9BACT|nr:hypothetical protein [Pontibacter actiniarum]ARS35444.1 hypothetical protein CA264_08330 [Pontibacter actiniarum]
MENDTSQNQNQNQNKNNNGNQQNSNQKKQDGNVLQMLQPHDMSRTVESAMHVMQGRQEKLPDLMQDVGHIILKATRRFSTTQLILAAGALTVGAILISRYSSPDDEYEEA